MTDTIFQKIIDGDLPADIVYEDELCLAFRDINPIAPTHILIVPKRSISQLNQATNEDQIALAMRDFADFFGEKMGIIPKTGKFDNNGKG